MVSRVYIFIYSVEACVGMRAHTSHAVHFCQGTSVLLFFSPPSLRQLAQPVQRGSLRTRAPTKTVPGLNAVNSPCFNAALVIVAFFFWGAGGQGGCWWCAVKQRRELPEGTRKSEDCREENKMA